MLRLLLQRRGVFSTDPHDNSSPPKISLLTIHGLCLKKGRSYDQIKHASRTPYTPPDWLEPPENGFVFFPVDPTSTSTSFMIFVSTQTKAPAAEKILRICWAVGLPMTLF